MVCTTFFPLNRRKKMLQYFCMPLLEVFRMKKVNLALICLLSAIPCQARTITVDCNGPSDFNNIQAAIDDSNNGDIVVVSPGIYTENISIDGKNITLTSTDPNDSVVVAGTTIRGDGTTSVVTFSGSEDASCKLAGFTITGGHGSFWGGGIFGNSTRATVTHCVITENTSGDGGGIDSCNGIISHCTITRNIGNYGAGLSRCHGIITHCLVSYNGHGTSYGSGINCCDATIVNCTIVSNENEGIRICNGSITSCIVWYNPDGIFDSSKPTYSCWPGGSTGTGNINTDPLFVDPVAADYHLSINSPCINVGDPCYSLALGQTDIDGDPRIMNYRIDIGADERALEVPFIWAWPQVFKFFAYEGDPGPEPQILSIRNAGIGTLSWQITEVCPWLEVNPTNGASGGEIDQVNLSVDISQLNLGVHTCNFTITADGVRNSPVTISVVFKISTEGVLRVPSEYETIQHAINEATNGDIVLVSDGIYSGSGNRNIDFKGKAITVCSENGPEVTIINCENKGRGFHFHTGEDSNSVLDGFTITYGFIPTGPDRYAGGIKFSSSSPTVTNCIIQNCSAKYNGGAIYCSSSGPTLRNCTIKGNSAPGIYPDKEGHTGKGGGIYCYSSSNPMISNCTINENSAKRGGGIWCDGSSNPTIENCTIMHNHADRGGGIYCHNSNLEVTHCTIEWNSTWQNGGGIYCYYASPTINKCKIMHNMSVTRGGGGIYCSGGSSEISNCVIAGNRSWDGSWEPQGGPGGGIHSRYAAPKITNCTIVGNLGSSGSGIYCKSDTAIKNCILWLNRPDQLYVTYGTPQVIYSNVQDGWVGMGNIDSDPCFVVPGYWDDFIVPHGLFWVGFETDYHLQSQAGRWDPNSQSWVTDGNTSPCVDAGNPGCPLGDEPNDANNIRINMGAYGGTAEASKTPANWRNIADLTNDWEVDFNDLKVFVDYWIETGQCIPSDLNRSQAVDFVDFAIFADN